MKYLLTLILTAIVLPSAALAAADKHSHKHAAGPNGGKILESEPLHAEFFVQPDRKVRLTFYDGEKAVAPTGQEVNVIAEAKSGKVKLEFEKTGDSLTSRTALPEGDGYRVVVQVRKDAASKPQNFRVDYIAALCGDCKRAEYACSCAH